MWVRDRVKRYAIQVSVRDQAPRPCSSPQAPPSSPDLRLNLFRVGANLLLAHGELQPHTVALVHSEELQKEGMGKMRHKGPRGWQRALGTEGRTRHSHLG